MISFSAGIKQRGERRSDASVPLSTLWLPVAHPPAALTPCPRGDPAFPAPESWRAPPCRPSALTPPLLSRERPQKAEIQHSYDPAHRQRGSLSHFHMPLCNASTLLGEEAKIPQEKALPAVFLSWSNPGNNGNYSDARAIEFLEFILHFCYFLCFSWNI